MGYFEFHLHERNVPDERIGRGSASIRIRHAIDHVIVFGVMISMLFYAMPNDKTGPLLNKANEVKSSNLNIAKHVICVLIFDLL